MGNFLNKTRESFFIKFLYDIWKYALFAIIVPSAHKFFLNNLPIFKQISTFHLSITVVVILCVIYVGQRVLFWGTKRIAILNNSRVFHFRKNATDTDRTKNKDFLLDQCKKAKNIHIIGATGYQTFARSDPDGKAILKNVLEKDMTGEIKIILLHPYGKCARSRADALGVPLSNYQSEIRNSVAFLKELEQKGKNVALKFYDQRPIWKMIILDDFLWLQHYHQNRHVERMPVYGISRSQKTNEYSLFDPLYDVFQKKWRHDNNPTYDFKTDEIVHIHPDTGDEERSKLS